MNSKVWIGAAAVAVLIGSGAFAAQSFGPKGAPQGQTPPATTQAAPSAGESQAPIPADAAPQGQAALGNPQVPQAAANKYTEAYCTSQYPSYLSWWNDQTSPSKYQSPSYGKSKGMLNLYNGCKAFAGYSTHRHPAA